jgi:hypothetical protein
MFAANMAKSARKGKVYVDYLRNVRGANEMGAASSRRLDRRMRRSFSPQEARGEPAGSIPACYSSAVERGRDSRAVTSRVIRPGQPAPQDDDWLERTPSERIEGVWTLTRILSGWNAEDSREPRLRRSVVHVQRSWR